MTYQLDIPEDELKQFHPFLHVFSKDKVIVQEGDRHDNRMFLLRQGEVNVLKWIGDRQQQLAKIEAVNFFGEIAVFSRRPRSATIIAATDPVVVYAFEKPNLTALLSDPRWSTLLIRRLTDNLEKMNDEYEQVQVHNDRLQNTLNNYLGTMLALYNATKINEAVKTMVIEALPELIKAHMREGGIELVTPDNYRLDHYRRTGVISEQLYLALIGSTPRATT